jgi:hypothetical protein
MAQTQECLENKYDNGKGVSKYGSIDEALTSYDFESARNLLSCYEDECFANDRRQSNMCTEHRWLIARNPHYKQMYKIVKSEISYFLINNDEKRAKNTALESDLMFLYDEMKENYTSD